MVVREKKHPFLILIPAYNEEETIREVLLRLEAANVDADILVVNDGSADQTEAIAGEFPISVVSHPTNLGYVSALHTGFKYACYRGYDYVIQFDADGQHDVNDLFDMMAELRKPEVDIVIGSRYLSEKPMKTGVLKKTVVFFFRALIYFLSGKQISDPTSGYRGYKRKIFETFIAPNAFPNEYPDSNLILTLMLEERVISEIPVTMYSRLNGVSMHSGIRSLLYLFQVSLSILIVWLKHTFRRRSMVK